MGAVILSLCVAIVWLLASYGSSHSLTPACPDYHAYPAPQTKAALDKEIDLFFPDIARGAAEHCISAARIRRVLHDVAGLTTRAHGE